MSETHLFEKVNRVPKISDKEIAEMRHIEPVLRCDSSGMFRRIKGADTIHPRNKSFLWDAEPQGGEFTFDCLNKTEIITVHKGYLFKPSLDEVYAAIRLYFGDEWRSVRYFRLSEPTRFPGSTDCYCLCTVMGGDMLVEGQRYTDGSFSLVKA